jgi:DNA-binding MarR family transcriptional regulator
MELIRFLDFIVAHRPLLFGNISDSGGGSKMLTQERAGEEELRRISRSAERLSRMLKLACDRQGEKRIIPAVQGPTRTYSHLAGDALDGDLVLVARSLLKGLTEQPDFGAKDIVFNPAWHLLLELFVAQLERRPVPVTNACLSLGTAQTTALRYLTDLERRGLIESLSDPADGRRRLIRLTPRVEAELRCYLQNAVEDQGFGVRIRVRVGSSVQPADTHRYKSAQVKQMNSSTDGSIQVRT